MGYDLSEVKLGMRGLNEPLTTGQIQEACRAFPDCLLIGAPDVHVFHLAGALTRSTL